MQALYKQQCIVACTPQRSTVMEIESKAVAQAYSLKLHICLVFIVSGRNNMQNWKIKIKNITKSNEKVQFHELVLAEPEIP